MGRTRWYIAVGIGLILASVLGYGVQILLFHRAADTFYYLLGDLAFLPLEVLIVAIVVNQWLQVRERNERLEKVDVLIGIFFDVLGSTLLHYFSEFDTDLDEMRRIADVEQNWTRRDFVAAEARLEAHEYSIDCRCADLNDLKRLLEERRPYMMDLLANPALLEHAAFTEGLWAISHLAQELRARSDLDHLPDSDYDHLASDMKRAYVRLVLQWLHYVMNSRESRPEVYSLAVRMNPFEAHPSAIIQE